jgi:hypothetical protein
MESASVAASNTTPKTSGEQPTKLRRAGAPRHNKNSIRHGLTATALPPGCTGVRKSVTTFRQSLEKIISDRNDGEITIFFAAVINSACRWEQHALLAVRWLRINFADLNHDQRLAYSREIARASSERDKCLKELGLHAGDVRAAGGRRKVDPLAAVAASLATTASSQDAPIERLA